MNPRVIKYLRRVIKNNLDSLSKKNLAKRKDLLFHLKDGVTVEVYGDTKENSAEERCLHSFNMYTTCYNAGIQVPEPYSAITISCPKNQGDLTLLTFWMILRERVPYPMKINELMGRKFELASEQYFSQLERIANLGIVVKDSSIGESSQNVIYSRKRKKVYMIDPDDWVRDDSEKLDDFRRRVALRHKCY